MTWVITRLCRDCVDQSCVDVCPVDCIYEHTGDVSDAFPNQLFIDPEECINCGACEPECPNQAITEAEDVYVIDPELCTECVGFHDVEQCAAVCPVDCCVADPNNIEEESLLIVRAKQIHPDQEFGEEIPSRFRT